MQISKNPQGKWVLLEGKTVVKEFDTKNEAIAALKEIPIEEKHKHIWSEPYWIHRNIITESGSRIADTTKVQRCDCGAEKNADNEDAWASKHLGWSFERVSEEEGRRRDKVWEERKEIWTKDKEPFNEETPWKSNLERHT